MNPPMRIATTLLILLLCTVGSDTPIFGRTWTDLHGRTISATFVRVHEGKVVLLSGSKPLQIPFLSLSMEDQQYLRNMLEAEGNGHLLPPEPVADVNAFSEDKPSPERNWGDLQGHRIRGRLVRVEGNWVYLLVGDQIAPYPLDGFRPRDRNYIQAWLNQKANTPGSLIGAQADRQAAEEAKQREAEIAQRKRDEQKRLEADRKRREQERLAAEQERLRREEKERQLAFRSERKAWKLFQTDPNSPPPASIVSNCSRSCSKCGRPIPDYAKSGERCPGCGMVWDAQYDRFGRPVPSASTVGWVMAGIVCIGILVCVLIIWGISLVLKGIGSLARRV